MIFEACVEKIIIKLKKLLKNNENYIILLKKYKCFMKKNKNNKEIIYLNLENFNIIIKKNHSKKKYSI